MKNGVDRVKIAIIENYAPAIATSRKDLISALRQHAEVIVFTPYEDEKTTQRIIALGVEYQTFSLSLRGANPLSDLKTKRELILLLKKYTPDIVICYTIKPIIWGSIAAYTAGVKKIYAVINGLGYVFTGVHNLKSKLIQKIVIRLYKNALSHNDTIFFQNPDDQKLLNDMKIVPNNKKTIVVNGSGVDLEYYAFSKPSVTPVRFLMIARLLKDKGIIEYVNAAKEIRREYPNTEFHLVGFIDSNPSAISRDLLEEWIDQKLIIFHGKCEDVRPIIRLASVYVLPSYREGTPRSVLEAMSMGRPIITTDAPGCRETVKDDHNGYLVPIKNVDMLVDAMKKFIHRPELVEAMGLKSREIAEMKYNVNTVNRTMLEGMGIV